MSRRGSQSGRALKRCGVAVAAAGAVALMSPAVASAAPSIPGSSDLGAMLPCAPFASGAFHPGWSVPFPDEQGQDVAFDGQGIDNDGSLLYKTDASTPRRVIYHGAGNVPLGDAVTKPVGFVQTGSPASLQIRVRGGNIDGGFTTLVWTASKSSDKPQSFDAQKQGGWWSTHTIGDIAKGGSHTLAELAAAAGPDAHVTFYGVSLQPGGDHTGTAVVDDITFNGCSTNFATSLPTHPGAL